MTLDPPPSSETDARILPFRRGKARPNTSAPGLEKFERDEAPDDYKHRMRVNLAGFAVLIVLALGGYWVADTMARMRKDQDCVLSGRRNCAPIPVEEMHAR